MDLAQALQMKEGLELIKSQLNAVRCCLVQLVERHRSTIMVARTHLQHALPTTFGCRVAIWLSALDRHAERLEQLIPRVLVVQAGGASGSLASLGGIVEESDDEPVGLKFLTALAEELGLFEPPILWHATRDGLVEVFSFMAKIGGSLAKIAADVGLSYGLLLF
jgi:3-carboxy-cis,cis-muconate cycloisomerase